MNKAKRTGKTYEITTTHVGVGIVRVILVKPYRGDLLFITNLLHPICEYGEVCINMPGQCIKFDTKSKEDDIRRELEIHGIKGVKVYGCIKKYGYVAFDGVSIDSCNASIENLVICAGYKSDHYESEIPGPVLHCGRSSVTHSHGSVTVRNVGCLRIISYLYEGVDTSKKLYLSGIGPDFDVFYSIYNRCWIRMKGIMLTVGIVLLLVVFATMIYFLL